MQKSVTSACIQKVQKSIETFKEVQNSARNDEKKVLKSANSTKNSKQLLIAQITLKTIN